MSLKRQGTSRQLALLVTSSSDPLPSAWFPFQCFHSVLESVPCLALVLVLVPIFAHPPQLGACLWCPFCDPAHHHTNFLKSWVSYLRTSWLFVCLFVCFYSSSLCLNSSQLCSNQGLQAKRSNFSCPWAPSGQ